MPEFAPCDSLKDLAGLDLQEILQGYQHGLEGHPEPLSSVYSRAFVHGWRSGRVDGGHNEADAPMRRLNHAFHSGLPDLVQ